MYELARCVEPIVGPFGTSTAGEKAKIWLLSYLGPLYIYICFDYIIIHEEWYFNNVASQ